MPSPDSRAATEASGRGSSVTVVDVTTVTTAPTGLTAAEVQERVARGQTNDTGARTSRKLSEIIRANVLTRFNAILGAAVAVILVIGPIQDATVALLLVLNSAIGIFQEVRAKRKLDQLAIKSAAPA